MVSIVIIGLGAFGQSLIEQMSDEDVEVTLIDKDGSLVEKYREQYNIIGDCLITNAISGNLAKLIPEDIDYAIVDIGGTIESSVLIVNELKKLNESEERKDKFKKIFAVASSHEHGEILSAVGATDVIYPDEEAAVRITPRLISSVLFNFTPISQNSEEALAEIEIKDEFDGISQGAFRNRFRLNAVAYRKNEEDFSLINDETFVLKAKTHVLVVGTSSDITSYAVEKQAVAEKKSNSKTPAFFNKLTAFFAKK